MAVAISFLEEGGQKATDVAQRLVEFLAAARTSLHFAIYDFRLSDSIAEPIRRVLQERAAAGVEVRIAYDAGKPNVPFQIARADPAPTGTSAFVSRLGSGIVSKPITGGDATMPKLMHHKYIIRDGHTPGGAIWTGSTNFTDDAWTLQENNIVTIDSPELCVFYENDFAELWELGDIATTGTHDTGSVRAGTTQMTVSFAPGEGRSIDHEMRNGHAARPATKCFNDL